MKRPKAISIPPEWTRAQVVTEINAITTTLRGARVSDLERLYLNEDRHALRRRLAEMDAGVVSDEGKDARNA